MKVLQFKVPYMILGGHSNLVILWSHKNVTKRTFGKLSERPIVIVQERSEAVTMWSSFKVWGMLFGRPSGNIQDVL